MSPAVATSTSGASPQPYRYRVAIAAVPRAEVVAVFHKGEATAQRCLDLGFPIIWDGVAAGHAYDPQQPPTESFKVTDPDGIVVDVTASSSQWPGVGL